MNPAIHISTHALRRYLERAKGLTSPISRDGEAIEAWRMAGVDIEAARAEIDRAVAGAARVGAFSVKSGPLRFVLRNRSVVTVVPVGRFWDGGSRGTA